MSTVSTLARPRFGALPMAGAVSLTRVSGNIKWQAIEAMLRAMVAEIEEGSGSRIHLLIDGAPAIFDRPHPRPDTDKAAVKAVRRFLNAAGRRP